MGYDMTRDAVTRTGTHRWTRMGAAAGVAVGLAVGGGVALASSAPVARQTTPAPAPAPPAEFVGITPVRVLDTRSTDGGPIGITPAAPLGKDQSIEVTIAGANGIPAEATSVAVNVTLDDDATAKSFLTVYPTGRTRPNASTNNAEPGLVMSNSAIFLLGTGGKLTVYNQQGLVNVIIDVTGYFVPSVTRDPLVRTGAATYEAGADATFEGTGWTGCTGIAVDVFGPEGASVGTGLTPTAGAITGPFDAPSLPGRYLLVARSTAAPACNALTTFEVTAQPS